MKRTLLFLFVFLGLATMVHPMALKTEKKTNAPAKFVDTYHVGLIMFDNLTGNTNYDYLAVTLPLVIRDELKKMGDFFIDREDVLEEKEQIDWDRPWNAILPKKNLDIGPSFDRSGNTFSRKQEDLLKKEERKKASLRKALDFHANVIIPNDQTMGEIARDQKCHFLIYGDYRMLDEKTMRVRVFFYNAIRGFTMLRMQQDFPRNKVLIGIPEFGKQMRRKLIRFPVASLQITTEPEKVMVYIDGRFKARTPCVISSLAATNHILTLHKDGYKNHKVEVDLKAGEKYLYQHSMELVPNTGILKVVSSPTGARVLVDLVDMGTTPVVISNLKAGSYRVTLELTNHHTLLKRVNIANAKTSLLDTRLRPTRKGELTVEQQASRWQTWMNITFWSSAGALVTYALLYFSYEEHANKWRTSNDPNDLNTARAYSTASDVALGLTIGALSASAFCLINYLIVDDKKLGQAPIQQRDFYADMGPNNLSLNWRF